MIYSQVFITRGHSWLGCPNQGRPLSIRQKHQLLLPSQLVAKASTYQSELMSLIRSQPIPSQTRQCLHWACPCYSFETRWLQVFALHCTQLSSPTMSTPTQNRSSTLSWFNCNLVRPPNVRELTVLVQTLASPSMRGLNALETNSPPYPKTSLKHGPLPQQKLQWGRTISTSMMS